MATLLASPEARLAGGLIEGTMIKQWKNDARVRAFSWACRTLSALLCRDDPNTRLIVIADCYGRLANRLTVIANAMAASDGSNAVVIDVAFRRVLRSDCFQPSDHVAGALAFPGHRIGGALAGGCIRILRHCAKSAELATHRNEEFEQSSVLYLRAEHDRRIDLTDRLAQSAPGDCLVVTGVHIDSRNRRPSLIDQIRTRFPWSDEDQEFADSVVGTNGQDTLVVGVHVRHGDYRTWRNGEHFHPLDQYVRAIEAIHQRTRGQASFLVVSDETQDLSSHVSDADIRWARGSESGDLALLSRCDLIVATHSSYANWASFIGRVPMLTMADAMDLLAQGKSLDPNELALPTVDFPELGASYLVRIADSKKRVPKAA